MDQKEGTILKNIQRLVDEEEKLFNNEDRTAEDDNRLSDVQVQLDQCWDLLRQRRALREAGRNPDEAKVRPAGMVEDYEQ